MSWTTADVLAREARMRSKSGIPSTSTPTDDEGKLHEQIISECKRRGWYWVRSRMDCPTTQKRGVPDFICAAKDGRTFWIEAKARNRKPTSEQLGALLHLGSLGHKTCIVRSLEDFLNFVDGPQKP